MELEYEYIKKYDKKFGMIFEADYIFLYYLQY